jgi:hypothetical protein
MAQWTQSKLSYYFYFEFYQMLLSCDTGPGVVKSGDAHGSCSACRDNVQTAIAITKATRPIARRYVQAFTARHRQSAREVVQISIARSTSILHSHRLCNYQIAARPAAAKSANSDSKHHIPDATNDRKGRRSVAGPYAFLVVANE